MLRVVLAGAHGFGRSHLRAMRRLAARGEIALVGICDLRPVRAELLEGLGEPEQSSDLPGLVADHGADIAVIATPIHTHADLALAAVGAGAHVLLEKPPVASLAEFDRLSASVTASGRACQVGFQSLGSAAPAAVRRMIADGAIGQLRGIGVAGLWSRDSSYYARAPWAGRRRLAGADVVDGALTNPFAHAVATALAIDGAAVREIELELFHAFDIEADDTSCLRAVTANGTVITAAVTLAAPEQRPPWIIVHGEEGRIILWYTQDRVELVRGEDREETTWPRTGLLDNLIAHIRGGEDLLVPLERTAAFMTVLEAVRTAPDPLPIEAESVPAGDAVRRVVPAAPELVPASAEKLALFSELDPRLPGAAREAAPR